MNEELRQEIENLLTCPICLKRLNAPVKCCNNGHAICNECLIRVPNCPQCRSRFASGQQTLLNNLIEIFVFDCKFVEEGCKVTGKPEDLSKHEGVCNFRSIKCIFSKNGNPCQDEIFLPNFADHIEDFHDSYIHELNSEYKAVLPKQNSLENNNCFFRVLKDRSSKLYFIEMTSYDNISKLYQISVHLIGAEEKAKNYIYTIDVIAGHFINRYMYSNYCVPNLMTPENVRKSYQPFFLYDQNEDFSKNYELKYNLKIKKVK